MSFKYVCAGEIEVLGKDFYIQEVYYSIESCSM